VLDEFVHLDDLGPFHAFQELGKRVMTWPFTLFILASSEEHRAREILRKRLHLLFGQFELMALGPVEAPTAVKWVEAELHRLQDVTRVSRFLIQWVGTCTWCLTVIPGRMKELVRLHLGQRSAESVLFRAVWDVVGHTDGVLYQWCARQIAQLERAAHGVLAREALIPLAQGARTTQAIAQRCGSRRHLSRALQTLVEQDLIWRKGACWVMRDSLFSLWVVTALALRDQRPGDREAASGTFERVLQAVWTQQLEAGQGPLVDRIGQLLARFRNETVSLDHKTGRLPAFEHIERHRVERGGTYLLAEGAGPGPPGRPQAGAGRRWCCLVHEGGLDEAGVAAFEDFCRRQRPRPSRKIVVARTGLDLNAKLLAKAANMWVWEPEDVHLLGRLYAQAPAADGGA